VEAVCYVVNAKHCPSDCG